MKTSHIIDTQLSHTQKRL